MAATVPFILISVGVALSLITIASLLIASLGRLNTDQSLLFFSLTKIIVSFELFQLLFRIIQFRKNSVEMFKQLVCI